MAEIATIARPYAEALFEAAQSADADAWGEQLTSLAAVAADPSMKQFADNPAATSDEVYQMIVGVAGTSLAAESNKGVGNFLKTVIDNGRLSVLPEIASQYHNLLGQRSGVADATIYSAFAIDPTELNDLVATLERRFKRKLRASVVLAPELIGGIRAEVGDEVLDTSVQGQLARMKVALTA
jgi:F-type H+-transporting ATPase subunit delta